MGEGDRDRFLLVELFERLGSLILSFKDLREAFRGLDSAKTLRVATGELGAEDKGDEKGERDVDGSENLEDIIGSMEWSLSVAASSS